MGGLKTLVLSLFAAMTISTGVFAQSEYLNQTQPDDTITHQEDKGVNGTFPYMEFDDYFKVHVKVLFFNRNIDKIVNFRYEYVIDERNIPNHLKRVGRIRGIADIDAPGKKNDVCIEMISYVNKDGNPLEFILVQRYGIDIDTVEVDTLARPSPYDWKVIESERLDEAYRITNVRSERFYYLEGMTINPETDSTLILEDFRKDMLTALFDIMKSPQTQIAKVRYNGTNHDIPVEVKKKEGYTIVEAHLGGLVENIQKMKITLDNNNTIYKIRAYQDGFGIDKLDPRAERIKQ